MNEHHEILDEEYYGSDNEFGHHTKQLLKE